MVSAESLTFMRPISVKFKAVDCKPRARMYAVFDSVGVNEFIIPSTGPDAGIVGGRIFADNDGVVEGIFNIPSMTFNTGTKSFKLTENPNYMNPEVPGSLYGYALADFSSTGVKQIYQTTIQMVEYVIIERPPSPQILDPLAQSFFTAGIEGGCFITSIDLFVQSKDEELPLIVEIREMVNGYPGPTLANPYARISKKPADILISDDASVATNFRFETPFYLEEDKDYCFVVLANTQSYYIFTCTMGERSLENDKIVFEQPHLGSLFKSQNNQTWTAEQYEDIKFKMYAAEFETATSGFVDMFATNPPTLIPSTAISTTANSNTVRAELTYNHNLDVGNKVALSVDSKGVYNGITATELGKLFSVSSVITPRVFEFAINVNANKTGVIESGGFVSFCVVDNKGIGYDESQPPVVTFSDPPPGGTTATGEAVIEFGKITSIKITHAGAGYVTAPTISIVAPTGSGATARASLDTQFAITTNRGYSMVTPGISNLMVSGTDIEATYEWTKGNYEGGDIITYTPGETVKFNIAQKNWLPLNAILASSYNEADFMSNNRSAQLKMRFSSSNKNVSPLVYTKNAVAMFSGNLINNQNDEVLESNNASGSLDSLTLVTGGVGYAIPPTVSFVNQYGCPGTGATASASIAGGTVTSLSISSPGTGYIKPPFVVFTGACTVPATATSNLNDFNTELQPNSGTAKARYITKVNYLAGVTESAKVIVEGYSGHNSSIDVYIRTTLKANGLEHTSENWTLMNCDTERNKSEFDGQTLDYEFYLDNIPQFDTYDIKIVLRSTNPIDVPWLKNFRAILTV